MIEHQSRHRANLAQAVLVPTLLLCLRLTGCADVAGPAASAPIPLATESGEPLVPPSGTALAATTPIVPTVTQAPLGAGGWSAELLANPTIAAVATQATQQYEARLTAIALTPTVPEPPWTPEPTPTFAIGMVTDLNCWAGMPKPMPVFHSCWRTQLNRTWYFIGAGYKGFTPADAERGITRNADIVGLLLLCPEPSCVPTDNFLYPAPRPDLRITDVQESRVILRARDSQVPDTFIFDILTHQWVAPVPLPTSVITDPYPSAVSTPTARP